MPIDVSIITASIPERGAMLAECELSIQAQTWNPLRIEHLIMVDEDREGCSAMVNRMAAIAQGDWLFFLADDDLALPRCIEAHMARTADAAIVYGPPLVWGIHDPWWYFQAPPAIPATALMRRDLFLELGGYDEQATREEDRGLWTRALTAGARFVRISDAPTWVYRLNHGGNKSLSETRYAAGVPV